jgi:hypothetical protein
MATDHDGKPLIAQLIDDLMLIIIIKHPLYVSLSNKFSPAHCALAKSVLTFNIILHLLPRQKQNELCIAIFRYSYGGIFKIRTSFFISTHKAS